MVCKGQASDWWMTFGHVDRRGFPGNSSIAQQRRAIRRFCSKYPIHATDLGRFATHVSLRSDTRAFSGGLEITIMAEDIGAFHRGESEKMSTSTPTGPAPLTNQSSIERPNPKPHARHPSYSLADGQRIFDKDPRSLSTASSALRPAPYPAPPSDAAPAHGCSCRSR